MDVVKLPATALYFVSDRFLLSGAGGNVTVYSVETGRQIGSATCVFEYSRIYGFRQHPEEKTRILVFGEKQSSLITINLASGAIVAATRLPTRIDWILDADWIHLGVDDGRGACPSTQNQTLKSTMFFGTTIGIGYIYAHNMIEIISPIDLSLVQTTWCDMQCMLYSARFITNRLDRLIIAAGTAFNYTILWQALPASPTDENKTSHGPCHGKLVSSAGVIFDIAYNPIQGALYTVSDDRGVRIYLYNALKQEPACSETDIELLWPLKTLFGHTARVWRIVLGNTVFFTVGEDTKTCLWRYDGSLARVLSDHQGRGCWAAAVCADRLATAGSDAAIKLYSLSALDLHASRRIELQSHLPIQDPINPLKPDFIRSICFVHRKTLAVVTNEGHVFIASISKKLLRIDWMQMDTQLSLSGHALLASPCCPSSPVATQQEEELRSSFFIATDQSGVVFVYSLNPKAHQMTLSVKSTVLNYTSKYISAHCFYIRSSHIECVLLQEISKMITVCTFDLSLNTLAVVCRLHAPDHIWSCVDFLDLDTLVLGGKSGSLLTYKLPKSLFYSKNTFDIANNASIPILNAHQHLPSQHKKGPVTSIVRCAHSHYKLITAGRDARLRVYTLEKEHQSDLLNQEESYQLCFVKGNKSHLKMEWIEAIFPDSSPTDQSTQHNGLEDELSHLNLLGFTGKVLLKKKALHLDVDGEWNIGGGHRTFSYNAEFFAHVKSDQLFILNHHASFDSKARSSMNLCKTLTPSLHGREITCMSILPVPPAAATTTTTKNTHSYSQQGRQFLMFTGSEDRRLGVSWLTKPDGLQNLDITPVFFIEGHLCSIRTLAFDESESLSFMNSLAANNGDSDALSGRGKRAALHVFSAGGKAELRCTQLHTRGDLDLDYSLIGTNPRFGGKHSYRIMGMVVYQSRKDPNLFYIAAVTSVGELLINLFDVAKRQCRLYAHDKTTSSKHCCLSITKLVGSDYAAGQDVSHIRPQRHSYIFAVGTTSGDVHIYDLHPLIQNPVPDAFFENSADAVCIRPLASLPHLHQSGVNAMAFSITNSLCDRVRCLLATGGDDNAIHCVLFDLLETEHCIINASRISQVDLPFAHSSSLKGISLLNGGQIMMSTSLDQRVSYYNLESIDIKLSARLLDQRFMHVSDVFGLVSLHQKEQSSIYAAVYGDGIQFSCWKA